MNDGGFIIKNNTLLNKCSDKTNFWIFNIHPDYLFNVLSDNKLASLKKRSININKVKLNDIIIISSKLGNSYSIIGLTMVDEIYTDNRKLFGYYESIRKLKLKSIKYFKETVNFNDIKKKLSINTLSSKEIIKISRSDMESILDSDILVAQKPWSLSELTIDYDTFLINAIKTTYELLDMDKHLKQMDIIEFIKIVEVVLNNFDVKISIKEIQKYYSKNVWKLNYRHVPSRDPDKNILLYDSQGKSRNYGYILFNHKE